MRNSREPINYGSRNFRRCLGQAVIFDGALKFPTVRQNLSKYEFDVLFLTISERWIGSQKELKRFRVLVLDCVIGLCC